MGAVLTGSNSQVEFSESAALLFGTICAAVDPVAVSHSVASYHVIPETFCWYKISWSCL